MPNDAAALTITTEANALAMMVASIRTPTAAKRGVLIQNPKSKIQNGACLRASEHPLYTTLYFSHIKRRKRGA